MSVACAARMWPLHVVSIYKTLILYTRQLGGVFAVVVVADALNNVAKLIASALKNVVIANLAAPLVAADAKLIFRRFARDFLMQMSPCIKQ